MSSVVIFSRNGVVAEWNKQGPYSVSVHGIRVRTFATREGAQDYAEKRASGWVPGHGKLITTHVYPPIPDRSHDWCAYYDNDVEISSLYGWGPTEAIALRDLRERIEEFNEEEDPLS